MNRGRLDFCVFVAKAMAVLSIISSLLILYSFGRIEAVSSMGYISAGQMMMNWPVIFGCIASSIYALLFAAMLSAVRSACYFSQDASAAVK